MSFSNIRSSHPLYAASSALALAFTFGVVCMLKLWFMEAWAEEENDAGDKGIEDKPAQNINNNSI